MTEIYDPNAINEGEAIRATAAAIKHIQQEIAKKGHGIGVRLATSKTGCNGYAYEVDIIETVNNDEKQFNVGENIIIAVPNKDWDLLKGTQLDYVREGINFKFVYENPNQSGACGCGESFSV